MKKELEKTYNPQAIEERLYDKWLEKKYFHAEVDRSKKPFTIVMPPPNITGQLHMGHALDNTMQDILIRYKRMQGYSALWQPGTDHAAIATEVKVIDKLRSEGINKEDLTREEFLKYAWDWKKEYGGRHREPAEEAGLLRRLGAESASPWTRAARRAVKGGLRPPLSRRAISTRAPGSSTGAPNAKPPSPTPRWSMRSRPAISGTSIIR